jgi:hypothetical protein
MDNKKKKVADWVNIHTNRDRIQSKYAVLTITMQPGGWWLTPAVPATQEAETRRILVQSQPPKIVPETLSRKNLSQQRAGRMAQGVVPEFKL